MSDDISLPLQGELVVGTDGRMAASWYRIFARFVTAFNAAMRTLTTAVADIATNEAELTADVATLTAEIAGKEPANAHLLKDNVSASLSVWYLHTPYSLGTVSSGTVTPNAANGKFQYAVNGGAHTLAPPANPGEEVVVEYTNNASAGAITVSGFTKTTGAGDTTSGHKFLYRCTTHQTYSQLLIEALQ